MVGICLATEDSLSEVVGLRLVAETGLEVSLCLRKGGNGYLRSRIQSFCEISRQHPVLLITDLDRGQCPAALIGDWFRERQRPDDFLVRVAVREIESWLLADHAAMAGFMGIASRSLPRSPDGLIDPKAHLISLARTGTRDVREALVPDVRAIAAQGVGYNSRLTEFVRESWQPARAALRSPSLARTRIRVAELADRV
jgi:hypothetical protein